MEEAKSHRRTKLSKKITEDYNHFNRFEKSEDSLKWKYLQPHNIHEDFRAKMVNWMIEVLSTYD